MVEIRVLLVEDNAGDAELFQHFVTSSCRVSVAQTGAEAFDRLFRRGPFSAQSRPHVVVLDINVPILGGYEILNILKRNSALRTIPVIVWSGSTRPKDVEKAFDHGACAYLSKSSDLAITQETLAAFAGFWGKQVLYPPWAAGSFA